MCLKSKFLWIMLIAPCVLWRYTSAQVPRIEDTLKIESVTIHGTQRNVPSSYSTAYFDSALISTYALTSLSELLTGSSSLHMKNYGVDGLSSIALRGSAANHTKLYWNGLSLNSAMLGQVDASLFPLDFIDDIEVNAGGGSLSQGSGGIGGNVSIRNLPSFGKGISGAVNVGLASFSAYTQSVKLNYAKDSWSFSTKVYRREAENDFEYLDYRQGDIELRRSNAASLTYSILQEVYHKVNNENEIALRLWYHDSDRKIPGIIGVESNSGRQFDQSFRSSLTWIMNKKKHHSEFTLGFLRDGLRYEDDSIGISSDSKINSIQFNGTSSYYFSNRLKGLMQLRTTYDAAESNGLRDDVDQRLVSLLTGFSWKLFTDHLTADVLSRQEVWDDNNLYWLPSLGFNYVPFKSKTWHFRANISRNLNFPTLNDRFWQNAGDESLNPEESIGYEIGLYNKFIKVNRAWTVDASLTYYQNLVDNWIIWLPERGVWRPQNIRKVRSEGVELSLGSSHQLKEHKLNYSFSYAYNETVNNSENNAQEAFNGNQLIYVPEHKGTAYAGWTFKSLMIWYRFSYTDQVFINAENTRFLNSFVISDAGIQKKCKFKKNHLYIRFSANNIFDEIYQTIADWPMPGRNYAVTLNYSF